MAKILKDIKEITHHREVLWNFTLREIKVKYKQSILGILWAILQPLSMMAIFTIIFSRFIKMPSDGMPYPIFSFAALLPWVFFSNSIMSSASSIVSNMNLLKKIYFPREIFPIASILAAFVDFCIAGCIFMAMLIFYKTHISLNILYLIPILLLEIGFILVISLFVAAANVYYRDVRYVIPLVTQLWMYASPVIYPISVVPQHLRPFYMLNPMAFIIDSYRKVLVLGVAPDWSYLGFVSIATIILLWFAYAFFKKIEMSFADVI
jgi:lipopolysaccharide transport system permease protein